MANTVLSSKHAGFHTITLNRPDKLNSFNVQQHLDLRTALDAAVADKSCRAIILTGAGRGFCAGQDLSDRVTPPPGSSTSWPTDALGLYYNPLVQRLASFPVPVICAVNGVAAGAGANIALACDIVLAAKSAKFLQAFAKIGLIADTGGTWTLPRLVGPARARALTMLAEPVDAATAEQWGMIYKAVDDAELIPAAEAMAHKLAHASTSALVTMRAALAQAESHTLDQQLALERKLQFELVGGPDNVEGVAAFFEKRAPKFAKRT